MEKEWELIRTKRNRFYYINENGIKSEKFFCAEEYHNGFGKVQKYEAGLVYFRDTDGNLSEGFYYAGDYKNGFARVLKEKDGPFQFRNAQGKLSEEFYDAYNYYNGFAIVRKGPIDPWQFRDTQGNLSEGFYDAYNYNDGFAIVRKGPIDPWQFRDTQGNLSEKFYAIGNYQGGFAKVQKNFGDSYQYRDIYGNLYDTIEKAKDALNKMQATQNQNETTGQPISTQVKNNKYANIENYFNNEVTVYDISPKDIYNNLDKIVAWEKYNCELELENANNNQLRDEIFEIYSAVAEYIKHTAYEYNEEQKKNQAEIDKYIKSLF